VKQLVPGPWGVVGFRRRSGHEEKKLFCSPSDWKKRNFIKFRVGKVLLRDKQHLEHTTLGVSVAPNWGV